VASARVTRDEGLEAENVSSMAFSPVTGSLWIGTNRGLTEIDPKERVITQTVRRQDGLVDNEIWWLGSVAAGDDGTIYFGTAKGLAAYRPALDGPNLSIPPLAFNDTRFSQDSRGNNELSIEYSALSFSNERRVRYKTRLIGYDKDWSSPTPDNKIRYTNLPALLFPKEYVFEVVAANDDGLWTETPIQYAIFVQPPWWFRWWSVVAQAVLVAGMGLGAHRTRTHKLKRRARELELTVQERTAEIRKQSRELQVKNVELEDKNQQIIRTQEQLIVQEKLASLGSLTAGIAHEIKNPLNFVNNFAELSAELVDELREDIGKHKAKIDQKSLDDIDDILRDLEENVVRINEHGKRADGIVKGMLLHSRGQSREFEMTDINSLLDENFNLAFHGIRGRDGSFNVAVEKDFDKSIGPIKIRPQDIGRVFLNVIDNACRATQDKVKDANNVYTPTVRLTTKSVGDQVEIRIRDNGNGMPPDVSEKVFNPFFTTRPTGQGTGLGLSISYDIVVGQHRGELSVESEEGHFTEFVITLPRDAS
jgi:signal transduction histidine kinase